MKKMQETYKDDREKLGRAMMELYKSEKVNPVAGCLPMRHPDPGVHLASTGCCSRASRCARRRSCFGSTTCPRATRYFILPLIMAVAMFVQYKLNPAPPDPMQAKMFMIMPLVMSAMFAFFPAGLVLYWVTNTMLSIAQQWNINRRIEAANGGHAHERARGAGASERVTRTDTIVAQATPPGRGGIGIVRVSGPKVPRDRRRGRRRAAAAALRDLRALPRRRREPIDAGLALFFPAPAFLHRRARARAAGARRAAGAGGAARSACSSSERGARSPGSSRSAPFSTTSSIWRRPRRSRI